MAQSVALRKKNLNAHFYFNESEITLTLIAHLYLSDNSKCRITNVNSNPD